LEIAAAKAGRAVVIGFARGVQVGSIADATRVFSASLPRAIINTLFQTARPKRLAAVRKYTLLWSDRAGLRFAKSWERLAGNPKMRVC
jgi:hypothetical protein